MRLTIDWGDQPGTTYVLDDDSSGTATPIDRMVDVLDWAQHNLGGSWGLGNASELQHTYDQPGQYTITATLSWYKQPGYVQVSAIQTLQVVVTPAPVRLSVDVGPVGDPLIPYSQSKPPVKITGELGPRVSLFN